MGVAGENRWHMTADTSKWVVVVARQPINSAKTATKGGRLRPVRQMSFIPVTIVFVSATNSSLLQASFILCVQLCSRNNRNEKCRKYLQLLQPQFPHLANSRTLFRVRKISMQIANAQLLEESFITTIHTLRESKIRSWEWVRIDRSCCPWEKNNRESQFKKYRWYMQCDRWKWFSLHVSQ